MDKTLAAIDVLGIYLQKGNTLTFTKESNGYCGTLVGGLNYEVSIDNSFGYPLREILFRLADVVINE